MTDLSSQKVKNWLFRIGGFFLLFAIFFALFFSLQPAQEGNPSPSSPSLPKTVLLSDISSDLTLEKPWVIVSSQDILVTAQANGKVARLAAKEGDVVKGGQPVVELSDTIASYKLQAERAKNWLDRAILIKEQTELTLQQQLKQAENAYKTAEKAFQTAQKISENTIKQASLGLSWAESQFDALKKSFFNQKIALINFMNSVLDASDALFGVTSFYEDQLRGQEIYVWAKDLNQKNQTRDALKALYSLRDSLQKIPEIPTEGIELNDTLDQLSDGYEKTISFVTMMITVLKNSISSEWTFGESERNKQLQLFQNFESWPQTQQMRAAFIAYRNQVNAQLNGESTLAQENAELSYQTTLENAENSLFSAEIAFKNTKINYETLLSNKDIQLNLLSNAIADAKIAYESALIQYNKLEVRSPVSGIVGEVLVSEWQEVWIGTPIFKVSGTKKQQIEVYLTADEYQIIQEDLPVQIEYQGQLLTGTIDAMSPIADKTNLFKAVLLLEKEVPLVGDIAKVGFMINVAKNTLLPLEKIKILNDNEGTVQILSGENIEELPVKIKKVWGNIVELAVPISWDSNLIL